MKVFKFGGASVKDAAGVRNLERVLRFTGYSDVFVVISAMGKTTNALEEVVRIYFEKGDFRIKLEEIFQYHHIIINDLMPENHNFISFISSRFKETEEFLNKNRSPNYDFVYDQVVSTGEMVSTLIVSEYLNSKNIDCQWIDARDYIKTGSSFREGKIDWDTTCENLNKTDKGKFYITQGFIGSDENYFTTTLGREGSDYTGAIIAYCLNAESLTIWKDVPGVMNADPRVFNNSRQLHQISYEEAIELSYYGASVIHPKTLQPLQRKKIPLFVKSFEYPENEGTRITEGKHLDPEIPCFIVKKDQHILQISTKNFMFIDEAVIRDVFKKFADNQLKVNLIQISAISLSLCVEDKYNRLSDAMQDFSEDFNTEIISGCSLYTVRHGNDGCENEIPNASEALIRQSGINTLQLVICNS